MLTSDFFTDDINTPRSPYDIGGADAWYHRGKHPEQFDTPAERAEYIRGYEDEGVTGRHQGKQFEATTDEPFDFEKWRTSKPVDNTPAGKLYARVENMVPDWYLSGGADQVRTGIIDTANHYSIDWNPELIDTVMRKLRIHESTLSEAQLTDVMTIGKQMMELNKLYTQATQLKDPVLAAKIKDKLIFLAKKKDEIERMRQEIPETDTVVNEIFADRQPVYAEGNGITADQLNVHDDVIITGSVQYQGATGIIDSFGRDKRFVVVNLYNHGKHSFHSSDVEGNDYAGSEEEEAELNRYGEPDHGLFGDDDRDDDMREGWSQKYKNSINCSHPKGFSQRAHCAGKRKHNESTEMEMSCPDCGMLQTYSNLNEIRKGQKDSNGYTRCWPGKHAEGTKKGKNGPVRNCVPNEGVAEDEGGKGQYSSGYIVKYWDKQEKNAPAERSFQSKEKAVEFLSKLPSHYAKALRTSQGVAEGNDITTANVIKQWEKAHKPDAEQQAAKDAWVAQAAKALTAPRKKTVKSPPKSKGVAEGSEAWTVASVDAKTNRATLKNKAGQTTSVSMKNWDVKQGDKLHGSKDKSGRLRWVQSESVADQGVAEGEYDSNKPYGVRYRVFAGREGRLTTKEYWTTSPEKLDKAIAKIKELGNFYEIDAYSYPDKAQDTLQEATRPLPGTTEWQAAVQKAQASGVTSANLLYNMFQNVRKRYFMQFLKDVGGVKISPQFKRELERAALQEPYKKTAERRAKRDAEKRAKLTKMSGGEQTEGVAEAKPAGRTIAYDVWRTKTPDQQEQLMARYPDLKVIGEPKVRKARVSKPKAEPISLHRVMMDIDAAITRAYPDVEPTEYLALDPKYADEFGQLNMDLLNRAVRKIAGDRDLHDYVTQVYQEYDRGGVLGMREGSTDPVKKYPRALFPATKAHAARTQAQQRLKSYLEKKQKSAVAGSTNEGYRTDQKNRDHYDDIAEWKQAVTQAGGGVDAAGGKYLARDWNDQVFGEFDKATGQGWIVSDFTKVNEQGVAEGRWFKTAYGWAGGRNEKTGKMYKHPELYKKAAEKRAKRDAEVIKKPQATPADEPKAVEEMDAHMYPSLKQQGINARRDGHPETANPFSEGSHEYKQWQQGWQEAAAEAGSKSQPKADTLVRPNAKEVPYTDYSTWAADAKSQGYDVYAKGAADGRYVAKTKLPGAVFTEIVGEFDKAQASGYLLRRSSNVSEVSAATLGSYAAKARKQAQELEPHAASGEYRDLAKNIVNKRKKGQQLANLKAQGRHGVVPATHDSLAENKLYFSVIGTTDASLRKDFGMRKDRNGWYLSESAGKDKLLEAHRAFGKPMLK